MIVKPLQLEEQIKTKCNYVAEIDYTDLVTTAGTSKTLVLFSTGQARDIVDRVLMDLVTPFDGGSTSGCVIDVGYNGASVDDADAFIDNIELHKDGTEILCDAGSIVAGTVDETFAATEALVVNSLRAHQPFAAQEAYAIEAVFTGAGANFTETTTGRVRVYFNVIRLTDLRDINAL